jgi:PqqD family protein of HPr-rel-A system
VALYHSADALGSREMGQDAAVTAPVRPIVSHGLVVVELDGEAVVYNEVTGDLHRLNPSATVVFDLCDGTYSVREMALAIAEAASVPAEQIEPEIRSLLRFFRRAGLLADSPASV